MAMIRKFAQTAMCTEDVRIDPTVNKYVWSKGIHAVPARIRVRMHRVAEDSEEGDKHVLDAYLSSLCSSTLLLKSLMFLTSMDSRLPLSMNRWINDIGEQPVWMFVIKQKMEIRGLFLADRRSGTVGIPLPTFLLPKNRYIVVAAINPRDEAATNPLNPISTSFVHRLFRSNIGCL